MSLYGDENEDALHFLRRIRVWTRSGFLTEPQGASLTAWADPGLKRTGPFFRLLLFLFTALGVQSVCGMVLWAFGLGSGEGYKTAAVAFAVLAWAAAEREAGKGGLYRHGVEEALALMGAGWAAFAVHVWVLGPLLNGDAEAVAFCLVAAVAGLAVFLRFGALYGAFIAAGFAAAALFFLDFSEAPLRTALGLYFIGVAVAAGLLARRGDAAREQGTALRAAALLGLYVCLNLRLPSLAALAGADFLSVATSPQVPRVFYWATYVLIFALPAGLLVAGWKGRHRVYLDLGLITGTLTLCVNKSYLGWARHAWDPAVLGVLMAGGAWAASKRWRGRTSGVTADDVWKPANHGLELAALGAAVWAPAPVRGQEGGAAFGGGSSGGGGAGGGY